MIRCAGTLLGLLTLTTLAAAQPALKDTGVDTTYLRTLAQTRSFQLGRPVRPVPTPDGKAILFLRAQPRLAMQGLFEFDVQTGKTRELLTAADILKGIDEKLSLEEKAARERMRVSVGGFTNFQLSPNGSLILLNQSGKLYTVERASKLVRELPTGKGSSLDPKFSPDGAKVAYVRAHDVYVLDLASQKETRVTSDGTALLTHGVADFVAQESMRRFTGYWWSPDSTQISYQQTNHQGVEVWYAADPRYPDVKPQTSYYPRPGKNNATVRLGVAPATGGKTTWIEWDHNRYPYLGDVHWSKHGPLCVTVQTRNQQEQVLLEADARTGKTSTLVSEKQPGWVNLRLEIPYWLPSGDSFLWVNERDDLPRVELRSRNGKFRRVLVTADIGYHSLISVDKKGTELIFTASSNPTESHLYRIALKEPFAEPERITKEPGLYTAAVTADHSLLVVSARPLKEMPKTLVLAQDGKPLGALPSVAENPERAPLVDLVEVGSKKRRFHAAVVVPRNYEVRKKYPVIVDVYGGPRYAYVLAAQNRWLLDQWYADQGFIVVAIDGRGTPGRGAAWERAIYQKFGSVPLEDQVAGLQALGEKFPIMDLNRVGIYGWSFGGYMAALAAMRRPDIFQAGVAGAPVCDWHDYDTHYTERFLGIPPKAESAYQESSLLTYAPELKRPLLILHGTADDNVYFRHSLRLVDALFRHGKEFEMVPLSGLTHMVPDPLVMERLHGRIALFFQKHLGRPVTQ